MRAVIGFGVLISLPWGGTFGAPALKDPPAKDRSLVGSWDIQSVSDWAGSPPRWSFVADGTWVKSIPGATRWEGKYTANAPALDLFRGDQAGKRGPMEAIYKIEGDTLTICGAVGRGARPTEFAAPPGSGRALYIFKRANKE
jgi:uncharacterized protein (TIGR03067 family)